MTLGVDLQLLMLATQLTQCQLKNNTGIFLTLVRVKAGLQRMGLKYVEFEQWVSQLVAASQLLFVVVRKPVVKFSKPKEVQLSGKGIGFYRGYLRRQKRCPVSQK